MPRDEKSHAVARITQDVLDASVSIYVNVNNNYYEAPPLSAARLVNPARGE